MKDKRIKITDWAGNILFIGPYDDNEVDKVLNANRSDCDCNCNPDCSICEGTGYSGDFSVQWIDEENDQNAMNVYDYINC